ncbi:MAG: MFS transporter [Anaerolineaceae bacterium]|nr:MFS transporter [Anaerolineaceae bacterium]
MNENQSEQTFDKWQVRFFTVWAGQAFSMLGSQLVGFAFVWYLTQKTGSATILAIASLMSMLPNIIIGPIAGTFVDRWNRKWVMIVFDSITALATFGLAVLFFLDIAEIWHIYVILFIRSSCGQFQWAAMKASTSLMVPKKHLARVAGANETLNGLMNIIAPALGAFLIQVMSTQGILMIDVSTAAIAVIPLLFFSIPQPVRKNKSENGEPAAKTSVWQDLKEGWQYVTHWPSLMALIFLAMLINFLINPAFTLLPLVVTEHFQKGAMELALLDSVFGVGVIIGGLVLSAWGGFKNRLITSLVGLIVSGFAVTAIGLAGPNMYWLAMVVTGVFAFVNPMINGPIFAVMQARVEPEIQGRVFSLLTAGAGLASPLGMAIAGPLADATNNQLWFVMGGILTIVAGAVSLLIPTLRQFGQEPETEPEPAKEPVTT